MRATRTKTENQGGRFPVRVASRCPQVGQSAGVVGHGSIVARLSQGV